MLDTILFLGRIDYLSVIQMNPRALSVAGRAPGTKASLDAVGIIFAGFATLANPNTRAVARENRPGKAKSVQ